VFGTHDGLIPLYLDMNIEYKSCDTLLFYDALVHRVAAVRVLFGLTNRLWSRHEVYRRVRRVFFLERKGAKRLSVVPLTGVIL
jgi:hypothetical protein